MKEMSYVITNPEGISARTAGLLTQEALKFSCAIQIAKEDMKQSCKSITGVVSMKGKKGDEVTFTFDGADEERAYSEISRFVKENL